MARFMLDTERVKTKKRGTVYRAWLREGRTKLASKQGFATIREAMEWANEKETEILQMRELEALEAEKATRITFLNASNDYLDWGKPRWGQGTYVGKVGIYARFLEFLDLHHPDGIDAELDDVPSPLIERYMYHASAQEGCSNKTGNRHCREIGAVWTHAITRGLMNGIRRTKQYIDNPARDIKPFTEEEYSRHVPTFETVQLYRGEARPGDESDYIEIMCNTIQRGRSIRTMKWSNVKLAERKAGFTHGKRDGTITTVWIHLNDTVYEILKRRFRERETDSPFVFVNPLSGNRYQRNASLIKHLFANIKERLEKRLGIEIEHVTGHALRHWGSHMLDEADVPEERIGKMLDHQRPSTTKIYLDKMRVDEGVANKLEEISRNGPRKPKYLKVVK